MNKELKQEFARLHIRLDAIEMDVRSVKSDVSNIKSDVSTLKSDVSTLKSDVAGLQYNTAVQFREVRNDLAMLMKNLDPLGDPNEAADLYGRVKYLELKLGIESGK
ncbi:MAG: hypothetical protein Q8R39_01660 [bacterium]|nr:hypothetical protein [bacterium]MDZ4285109.1 hypothetical protein [Patescibacteria group bacterium]